MLKLSEKRRAPSWTDRILWKKSRVDSPEQERLELLDYTHCMNMMMSDHKPVRALMSMNIRKIDSRLQKKTHDALVQQLKESQDAQPRGEISTSYVDFEKVHFLEYKEKTILLENTGRVLTLFRFLPKNDEVNILPPWLQVSPISGVLAPGERAVIRFEVMVDPTISAPLNRGEQKIEDILILRLENSKDFFISISGDYVPTCFGVPLERLSEMTVPISEQAAQNLQKTKPASNPSQPPSPVLNQIDLPKELWKVMNFLWNSNMFRIVSIQLKKEKSAKTNPFVLQESLFLYHGDLVISTYIRQCLDNGEQFDTNTLLGDQDSDKLSLSELTLEEEGVSKRSLDKEAISANSMIDVLVAFLDCLPDPVIPTSMYERALEASESVDAMNMVNSWHA